VPVTQGRWQADRLKCYRSIRKPISIGHVRQRYFPLNMALWAMTKLILGALKCKIVMRADVDNWTAWNAWQFRDRYDSPPVVLVEDCMPLLNFQKNKNVL
jgi:hypothetical protein